ncbi:hypothetical protein PIB30_028307 [Stylosanthes scabra]|uniref:Spermatogenesis-associated protein 20-like TRX domain-containing protein n=1 Tax=Stylosanthes scabra TaxID=79078 RepID=A0ABU6Y881_9FABA|nr:hypothetical protein [Stylosanthes scabra]
MASSTSSFSSHSHHKHSNRLASEQSPYLLQHAHNPVDWYPWGEEAFAEARRREVPIFLSIGYSTCHWCHVMEVESFEDEGVAKLLNDGFVSIKVDREERPDVDKVYMTYVQALYGGGGWPLSVFLSPDLKPLMGGTYFPPEDKYGRPGFKTILRKVKEAWDSKKDVLVKSGAAAIEQLSEALSSSSVSDKLSDGVPDDAVRLCAEQLSDTYDSEFGGFGSAPKFPRPVETNLMLYHSKKLDDTGKLGGANRNREMVFFTLKCMAKGGIHDHIGGGFHRYSVDECWHVPHFEKMLYDQGQIANVEDILGKHADLFIEHYYIKQSGNCDLSSMSDPHDEFKGKNVLIERKDPSEIASKYGMSIETYKEILGECRRKLFEVRSRRARPHLDDKVIVSWNGLAISSFARASKILLGEAEGTKFYFPVVGTEPKEYMQIAEKAALFIKKQLYNAKTQRLNHSFRNSPSKAPGFLDDYAFLISGLLDLYEDGGGYFNNTGEDTSVLLRVKEDHDGAEPSGNSVSAINLIRLASMVAESKAEHYKRNAEHLLAVFEKRLKALPMAVPLMCCAADMLRVPSRKQVVVVGDRNSEEFERMLAAAHASYDPNKTVLHIDPNNKEEMEFWELNNSNIALMAKNNHAPSKVVALVCQNFTCSPPVIDPSSLAPLLSKKSSSSST